MNFRLETERLTLRSWRDGDAEMFDTHLNRPAIARWVGGHQTRSQIDGAVARIQACEAENGFCFWAIERRADAAFLGFCGLKLVDAEGAPSAMIGSPEIGWRLREDAWGQGYAKEAAVATLQAAFTRFGLGEVFAITLTDNAPSWGLMRRLGMTARPDLDFDMSIHGRHVTYRMGADTWTG